MGIRARKKTIKGRDEGRNGDKSKGKDNQREGWREKWGSNLTSELLNANTPSQRLFPPRLHTPPDISSHLPLPKPIPTPVPLDTPWCKDGASVPHLPTPPHTSPHLGARTVRRSHDKALAGALEQAVEDVALALPRPPADGDHPKRGVHLREVWGNVLSACVGKRGESDTQCVSVCQCV